jgi:hypothetical protein
MAVRFLNPGRASPEMEAEGRSTGTVENPAAL